MLESTDKDHSLSNSLSGSNVSPFEVSESELDDDLEECQPPRYGLRQFIPLVPVASRSAAFYAAAFFSLFAVSSIADRFLLRSRPPPPVTSFPLNGINNSPEPPNHRLRPPILLLYQSPEYELKSVHHWLLKADARCDITKDRRYHVECDQRLEYRQISDSSTRRKPTINLTWMGTASYTSPASEALLKDSAYTQNLGTNSLPNIKAVANVFYTESKALTTIRFSHDLSGSSNWEFTCFRLTTTACLREASSHLQPVGKEEYDATLALAKHDDHPFTEPV